MEAAASEWDEHILFSNLYIGAPIITFPEGTEYSADNIRAAASLYISGDIGKGAMIKESAQAWFDAGLIVVPGGSATMPSIVTDHGVNHPEVDWDTDTGIFCSDEDEFAASTGGMEVSRWTVNGVTILGSGGNYIQITPMPSDTAGLLSQECVIPFSGKIGNTQTGRSATMDWCGLIRTVEALSGKTLMWED